MADHVRVELTAVGPEQTVVRLEGEIDLSMAAEFAELLVSLPAATAELVLDVAVLTFCDATLAGFVAVMLGQMPVTVIHPNRPGPRVPRVGRAL